jgi:RHS repeat-associated protein
VARKVSRTYDARNRLKTLAFPDGRGNQTWTWAPDGLPASVSAVNPHVTNPALTTYSYNRRRLLSREVLWPLGSGAAFAATYGYDANGHVSQITYPTALTVLLSPDALGQPTRAGTFATDVSYHPNGAIKQFTYGNGIVHTLTQNVRGLPDTSKDAYGATAFLSDGYDYDGNGNVAAITDGATGRNQRGNRTMAYDGLDRLTSTVSPMFGTATYAYDALDNLTRAKVSGGSFVRDYYHCYNTQWQLAFVREGPTCTGSTPSPSRVALEYDLQGNVTDRDNVVFDFDFGNRLRHSPNYWYAYDGQGRRILSCASGACNYQFYSLAGQRLYVDDKATDKPTEYIYLGGSLIAQRTLTRSTGVYDTRYLHTDALGSPALATNQSRAVAERTEYEPYGRVVNRALRDGPGYTGHVEDKATAMVYMQQRYYDPMIGRFLSVDPVTAYTKPGQNFNRYWYANNNPYKFTDPDGRQVSEPRSCHSDNSCIPLSQVNRGDTTMMKVVAAPIAAGGTAGIGAATGATAATVSAAGRLATAAEAKYVATGIAAVEKGRAGAQVVAAKAAEVGKVVAAKANELKTQVMTSQVAIASMRYREQLTDAFEGMVGQFFGVEGPAKSSYEIGGEVAAEGVMTVTDTEPRH